MDPVVYAEAAFRHPLKAEKGDRALIVYEADRYKMAEPSIGAAKTLGLETLLVRLPAPDQARLGIEEEIRETIKSFKPDTCVNVIRYRDTETSFRSELLATERLSVKTVGHSPGGTPDMFIDGGLALTDDNYFEMYSWMDNLVAQTKGADSVHITAPNGTDFTVGLRDSFFRPETMNLPTGQVSCVPPETGTLDGRIVCIHGGTGAMRLDAPVVLDAVKGSVNSIDCNDPELLEMVSTEFNRDLGARMTNEIGIGANRMAKVRMNPLDAEKNRGSISIGFGGPHNDSVAQLNLLIPRATAVITRNGVETTIVSPTH